MFVFLQQHIFIYKELYLFPLYQQTSAVQLLVQLQGCHNKAGK